MPTYSCVKLATSNKIIVCLVSLCLIIIFLPACKKSNGSHDDDPDQTNNHSIPPPTPVVTSITTYIPENIQNDNPVELSVNDISSLFDVQYNAFHSDPLQTDMYQTRLSGRNMLSVSDLFYFNMERVLPVTNSVRNYIDAVITKRELTYFQINQERNGDGVLPDGATFTFSSPNPDPGGTQGYGYSAYLNPATGGFALSMPSFSLDSAGSRWFLKSFGAWYFDFPVFDQANIKLIFSIPNSMLNTAPDSIFCYTFKNWKWTKGGVAKKVNNTYVASFKGRGIWNFAAPVTGNYLKLKVRTDKAATITNAKVVAKVNSLEVATARTDAEGNVLLFVPVNEPITLELSDSWQMTKPVAINIDAIKKASEKEVVIPQKETPYLITVNARVLDCLGNPVQNGTAVLSVGTVMPMQYYIPIQKGAFSTAVYVYGGGYAPLNVTLLDASNKPVGEVNQAFFGALSYPTEGRIFDFNFYTCSNYTNLYCNYSLDGATIFQKDDAGAFSSFLSVAAAKRINTQQGSQGIDIPFEFGLKVGPWNYYSGQVIVNGVTYQIDGSVSSENYMYRVDPDAGGYTEGCLLLNLTDNAGAKHRLSAVFRLKNKS